MPNQIDIHFINKLFEEEFVGLQEEELVKILAIKPEDLSDALREHIRERFEDPCYDLSNLVDKGRPRYYYLRIIEKISKTSGAGSLEAADYLWKLGQRKRLLAKQVMQSEPQQPAALATFRLPQINEDVIDAEMEKLERFLPDCLLQYALFAEILRETSNSMMGVRIGDLIDDAWNRATERLEGMQDDDRVLKVDELVTDYMDRQAESEITDPPEPDFFGEGLGDRERDYGNSGWDI